MKILFLATHFYPEQAASSYLGSNRNQAFVENGFNMVVYTPTPSRGVSNDVRKQYKKHKRDILYDGKIIVNRFNLMREGQNPIGRAFRYTILSFKLFLYGLFGKDSRNADIIYISSTPPIKGAIVSIIKKIRNIPIVYNLQDIFPDSLVGSGLTTKGSLLWKIGRLIEDFTYRNVDKIIVISEEFKQNIIAKGVDESKIEVIYNWVDENKVIPISRKNNKLFDELGLSRDLFYIVYAGNLGHAQNLEIIIQAACILKNYEKLKFLIFGSGGLENELKNLSKNYHLNNLRFFPIQNTEKISEVYSLGNASVVSCKPGLGKSAMPSKTWNIMSSGTAILANFDSGTELQRIIEDNKVGIFSDAGNIDEFISAVLKLFNDKAITKEMGINGRKFILNNLTRERGTTKYVEVMKSVVKTN